MASNVNREFSSNAGEPTWEVVQLFPSQGDWSEADFFGLHTNRMTELVEGKLEILPMPNWLHQLIVVWFMDQLRDYLKHQNRVGDVLIAPLPVRLFPGTIREPDVLYVLPENIPDDPRGYPERMDLAVEVVSEGDDARRRDYESKPVDYAKAGVSEYWIVDPQTEIISVLTLENETYSEQVFRPGEIAASRFLDGLTVDVSTVFALGRRRTL